MDPNQSRATRLHVAPERTDFRTDGQRDRDRILHSSAFRRLSGVTQVVSPATAPVSHSRLTHTLKVAQIAVRIAQKLVEEQKSSSSGIKEIVIDPDVVEAASLAHDLGHPPFGHVAEEELNRITTSATALAGFEGNAQSFRIVTKVSLRRTSYPGLNLSRATLNAMLKYPWTKRSNAGQSVKCGAYDTEQQELEFARELMPRGITDERMCAEAAIMDWADDIAYSIHDVEDFYKVGLIPLDRLVTDEAEREIFLERVFARWDEKDIVPKESHDALRRVFHELFPLLPVIEPYNATRDQRARLRALSSYLIARYVNSIRLNESSEKDDYTEIAAEQKAEIRLLKELTWIYVITNPALARAQYGKRQIIRRLYEIFMAASEEELDLLPISCREQLEDLKNVPKNQQESLRKHIIADTICLLTDNEAIRIVRTLGGTDPGMLLDNSHY